MLAVASSQKIQPSEKVPHKIYQVPYKPGVLENTMIPLELKGTKLQYLLKMAEVLSGMCEGKTLIFMKGLLGLRDLIFMSSLHS